MTTGPDFLLVQLLSLIPRSPGPALDAGSGAGRNVSYLEGQGYSVLALDRVHPPLPFKRGIRADIRCLPHPSGTFGLVLCDSVLDTAVEPPDCAISELKRVLKPGGHLIVVVAAAEGSDPGLTFAKETVLSWVQDLELLELLYVRVDYPPAVGVRAQWALLARRP